MRKQTEYLIIGIGIASILVGIYGAVRTGELINFVSEVIIGVALIGTIIIERNKSKSELKQLDANYVYNSLLQIFFIGKSSR